MAKTERLQKLTKKELEKVTIELGKNGGLSLWITESDPITRKTDKTQHWLMDGSYFRNTGRLNLGYDVGWKYVMVYNKKENCVMIMKRKKNIRRTFNRK